MCEMWKMTRFRKAQVENKQIANDINKDSD